MPGAASWWRSARKNLRIAKVVASGTLGGASGLGSISRWGAVGAGLGAVQGLADNVVGEDRTSVLGGAIRGAVTMGGLRALKLGLNTMGKARGAAATLSGNNWGGVNRAARPGLSARSYRRGRGLR